MAKTYISRKMVEHLKDHPDQAFNVNALVRFTGASREQVVNGMSSWIRNHDAKGERHGIQIVKRAESWKYSPSLNGQGPSKPSKGKAPSTWDEGQMFELTQILASGALALKSDDGRLLIVTAWDEVG